MSTAATARIDQLFERTKLACFGRYTLRVPVDTELTFGENVIDDGFITYPDAAGQVNELLTQHWNKVLMSDDTAELIEIKEGPKPGGKYFWYYRHGFAKEDGAKDFYGITLANGHAFSYQGMALKGGQATAWADVETHIRNLRYRDPDEVPQEPGVCLKLGFVRETNYQFRERFDGGIYIPSLPDISFSVSSNKKARTVSAGEKGLLQSIQSQRNILGRNYPKLDTLREGKKTVGIWAGEESLVRRKDGTHDFEWEFISDQRTVSHPGVINAKLFSKVEQDRIGAAAKASLSDEEAIALWDRLLGSLDFRVPVPGGPVSKGPNGEAVALRPLKAGEVCPVAGMWRPVHPKLDQNGRADLYIPKGDTMPGELYGQLLRINPNDVNWILVQAL